MMRWTEYGCARRTAWLGSGLWLLCALMPAAFAGRHKNAPPAEQPVNASLPPAYTIPVAALGFAAPGDFYLGERQALVSLDFVGEDRLLFTFRVPGLLHRDPWRGEPTTGREIERQIRAVVLRIADGNVEAETLWTLRDRERYLYMLDGGQFLLRDRDTLSVGDAGLQLTPLLHFPGPLASVEVDPEHKLVVASSLEPAGTQARRGDVTTPETAQASITTDQDPQPATAADSGLALRIVSLESGKVMLYSRIRQKVHVPVNAEGYIEPLRSRGSQWLLNMDYFTGGSRRVGTVDSTCVPGVQFIAASVIVAQTCDGNGGHAMTALTLEGKRLWQQGESGTMLWPVLTASRSGTRLAHEVLVATHSISASTPLDTSDIKMQQVEILDVETGKQVLRAQASPIYDAGGNVALAPSGKRAAVLMEGKIQVFELP